MKFTEICITTNQAGTEMLSGVFMNAGVTTFIIDDPNDLDLIMERKEIPFDYVEPALLERDRAVVTVKAYLALNEQGALQLDSIKNGVEALRRDFAFLDLGGLEIALSEVDDADWADNWKQFFHPLKIGSKFIVMPTWESCDPEGRKVLLIDPESSFGSGQHETTALVLELLEETDMNGKTVLDMGCGSGILGIGCALCGAASVLGVDIDENASRIANKNAAVNSVESVMTAICGNVLTDKTTYDTVCAQQYDVIAANIVADVLIAMAPMFASLQQAGGVLVCSGIIGSRTDEVIAALEANGFAVARTELKNDWAALLCHRK